MYTSKQQDPRTAQSTCAQGSFSLSFSNNRKRSKRGHSLIENRLEGSCILNRHIGKHLPIQPDVAFAESIHEFRIADTMLANRGIDPCDPEFPEIAFPLPAADIRMDECVMDGFLCGFIKLGTAAPIAFGQFQYFLFPPARGNITGNSWHL